MNQLNPYHITLRNKLTVILLTSFLFFISPLSALAQTLNWSPESMFFEDTPVGTTATMTLTLTAAHADVNISNVEWTFNQIGEISFTPQYGFVEDRPVPTTLFPGESMDIVISFTPEVALTFASATLLVTNSSLNAGALYYGINGIGAESNDCFPFVDCGGICVDTSIDVNNCGACDNVCEATANATTMCESFTCSFVCDEGYEPVGSLCLPILVDPTLDEMMLDLLSFIYQSLDDDTLVGFGPGASAQNRLSVVLNWLYQANNYINKINPDTGEPEPNLELACIKLNDAHLRSDGGYPFRLPPDFIAGESTNVVNSKILNIIDAIEGCEAAVAITRPVK